MSRDRDDGRAERLRDRARERLDGDSVAEIVGSLDSDDPEVRAGATWALAEVAADHPDGVPVAAPLAATLDDEDVWVRRGATWTVAEVARARPRRAKATISKLASLLRDEDALVRENAVVAVSAVAAEYPRRVEPALSELATLIEDEDGVAHRRAIQAFRRVVEGFDGGGNPLAVRVSDDVAEALPGDVDVIETGGDGADAGSVDVAFDDEGGDDGEAIETAERGEGEGKGEDERHGPPESVSAPPSVTAQLADFDKVASIGTGPLTTADKARISTASGEKHVVATVRMVRRDRRTADLAEAFATAVGRWADVDDHDHVVSVLERGRHPRPWAATEYADGGTLERRIGSIGVEKGLWYVHCLVRAVSHAHAHGVVHGGLRPGVVHFSKPLVSAWSPPKIADWGFGDVAQVHVSPLPVPVGYAAPEQVNPDAYGRTDHATDVYQLGAVAYAVLTGRPPFTGDRHVVAKKVESADPAPASEHNEILPSAVDDALSRAMAKRKTARFETVDDLRRDLELVVERHASMDV